MFVKYGDEHRRDVLQAILGIRPREYGGMLAEFVRDLVDDECGGRFRGKGIEGFLKQRPLGLDLHRAERDAGYDIIAMLDPALVEFRGNVVRVGIDDMDAGIIAKLMAQMVCELGVEFKQEKRGLRVHATRDFPGVAAFAGAVFSDDAGF